MTRAPQALRGAGRVFDFSTPAHLYAKLRVRTLRRQDAARSQERLLTKLVDRASDTQFGRHHRFSEQSGVPAYQAAVPLRTYGAFWSEWWRDPFPGLVNVTWPGRIPFFALTSGTTTGRSKYIAYTQDMRKAAVRGFLDLVCCHLVNNPDSRLFGGQFLGLTGPISLERRAAGVELGAVSAISAAAVPQLFQSRVLPPADIADLSDWHEKIRRLAPLALNGDIRLLGGSPNWILVFLSEVARQSGGLSQTLVDWFPNLELIVHGGVNFAPYKDRFSALLEGGHAETRELYSASEGVFAYADRGRSDGLRLHLDGSVFFEFVPLEDVNKANPRRFWVANAETGVDYALAVTTAAGLWSYLVGDIVRLTSISPPRLVVKGRVSQGLSAFGEHLLESEIDAALSAAASAVATSLSEYTVSARSIAGASRHVYFVETETELSPGAQARFVDALDSNLARSNSDYEELRAGDLAICRPEVTFVTRGSFSDWMETRRALGGQNKVPRIISDPALFEDIAGFLAARTVGRIKDDA